MFLTAPDGFWMPMTDQILSLLWKLDKNELYFVLQILMKKLKSREIVHVTYFYGYKSLLNLTMSLSKAKKKVFPIFLP